jgi:hypothetical protein
MTHKIINTGDYLLIVDDSEIKYKTWCLDYANQVRQCLVLDIDYWKSRNDAKKIIAHLPLNNSPILEGVDLLPPIEDEVEKLAYKYDPLFYADEFIRAGFKAGCIDGFKAGYNKAKEKYKYTEEDLIDVFNFLSFSKKSYLEFKDFIQSLQQPKIPVAFLEKGAVNGTWVGEYIF